MGASAPTEEKQRPRRGLGPRLQRGCAACLDIGTLSGWRHCGATVVPGPLQQLLLRARRAARPDLRAQ